MIKCSYLKTLNHVTGCIAPCLRRNPQQTQPGILCVTIIFYLNNINRLVESRQFAITPSGLSNNSTLPSQTQVKNFFIQKKVWMKKFCKECAALMIELTQKLKYIVRIWLNKEHFIILINEIEYSMPPLSLLFP